jgi:hypothetical protein
MKQRFMSLDRNRSARPAGWVWAGLLMIGLLWGAVGTAEGDAEAEAEPPPETWHCTAYVRGPMGRRVIDYWSRGADMRARTLIDGHPVTTLIAGGRYVVFDGLTGEGVDIARSAAAIAEDVGRARPFAFELEEIAAQGGERIEEIAIGGMKGEIWQVRDGQGRRKLWVTQGNPSVPIRLETFDRASGDTIELDYQGWSFNLPMADSFFQPPEGLDLKTFDQEGWIRRKPDAVVPAVPILYPDLLFGRSPRSG